MLNTEGILRMKRTLTCLLILLVASLLTITFVPNVSSQTLNVKILDNYTFYEDSLGNLVVIGEVQNIGSNVIANISLAGEVTTDAATVTGGCRVSGNYLLPGQKAPFYMEFYPQGQNSNQYLSWNSVTKSDIQLAVYKATETSQYEYQNVQVISSQATPTATGEYWVTAELQNNGTQTAQGIVVFATFYNSEGLPIASGNIDSIDSMAPGSTQTIKVPAWDLNQTIVTQEKTITAYSLLVQVASPMQTDGNIPVVSSNPTPIPAGNAVTTGDSASKTDQTVIYVAVIVVIALIITVVVLLVRRRKSPASQEAFEPPRHTKKTRRERRDV